MDKERVQDQTNEQDVRKIISCVTFNGFREDIYSDMDQYDVRELYN